MEPENIDRSTKKTYKQVHQISNGGICSARSPTEQGLGEKRSEVLH
jgi:hypothetical protein